MDNIPEYYNGIVHTQWESPVPNALCTLIIISEDETYQEVSIPTRGTELISKVPNEGIYYRYLRCLLKQETGQNKTINIGYFRVYLGPPPEEPKEGITENNTKEEIHQDAILREYIFNDYSKETEVDKPDILGKQIQSDICKISILENSINRWECNIGIQVSKIEYTRSDSNFYLQIYGTYPEVLKANIQVYECKPFKLVDPKTWFRCKERLIDWFKADIYPIYISDSTIFKEGTFTLNRIYNDDISKTPYTLQFQIHLSHKRKKWIDLVYTYTNIVQIPPIKVIENKPLSFPLDRKIGVTQWYGCTQYQCPHSGIDFGARLNNVLSVGDGNIVSVGYDKYGGECNQGGNFVIIKHTNGTYSTYFHLEEYFVKKGQNVKKDERIGISGNSGKWNCQNLGYHLHFGIRKNIYSSSHTNPVPYIDIDWNTIPTIGKDIYPKRLTGENPHPNF